MAEVVERIEPATGWGWARIEAPIGEPFRSAPDGVWDQGVEVYVVPDRLRWTREVDGQLRVAADFVISGHKVLCVGVQHFGSVDQPVSTRAVRDVALDEVGRAAIVAQAKSEQWGREQTEAERASGNESAAFFHTEHVATSREDRRAIGRAMKGTRGRPRVPDAELERAADIYRSEPRHPVQAVAAMLDLSPRTAARRIEQARKAGLLPPTTPGKAKA